MLSQNRTLYFATTNTRLARLRATAIEDRFVDEVMQHSRARSIVLILDCCHSGAFGRGLVPKSAPNPGIKHRFDGRGRITLTASTDLEYAFEEADADTGFTPLAKSRARSLFTGFIVEGLTTGDADLRPGRPDLSRRALRLRVRASPRALARSDAREERRRARRYHHRGDSPRPPEPTSRRGPPPPSPQPRHHHVRRTRWVVGGVLAVALVGVAALLIAITRGSGTQRSTGSDARARLRIDGDPVAIRFDSPGQNALVRFAGRANQRVALAAAPVRLGETGDGSAQIDVRGPGGAWLTPSIEQVSADNGRARRVSLGLIEDLELQIAHLTCELKRQGVDHRYIPLLVTAPGFGWINAFTVASEIGDITRFPSPAKLVGYTGLCPRVIQSGNTDRRGPIGKRGPRYLRWGLFEAAMNACKHPIYAERYQHTKRRLGRQCGPKVAQIELPASSPKRSGTCSPATNRSLRQAPVVV